MKKINFNLALLIFVSVAAIIQPVLFLDRLPEQIAAHFSTSGEANSFMPKNNFILFSIGLILFLDLIFLGLTKLMNVLSDSGFNLPNKDYWLHESRREKTVRAIKKMLYNTSTITIIFLMAIMQKIIECNIDGTFKLSDDTFLYLIFYVMGLSIYIIWLFLKFSKIPKENLRN